MNSTRYDDIITAQRPVHFRDAFYYKHPPMPLGKRAKVFSPFAALSGYEESVRAQEVVYTQRYELCEDEQEELERKLQELYERCLNSRMIRENAIHVEVHYFEARRGKSGSDDAGLYKTVTGTVTGFDPYGKRMMVDGTVIAFADIREMCIDHA